MFSIFQRFSHLGMISEIFGEGGGVAPGAGYTWYYSLEDDDGNGMYNLVMFG